MIDSTSESERIHEIQIVKRALSHASTEVRAAQRCVEVLANLFEDMRHELYPHQASRIWYVLNQISNIQRILLSPPVDKWPSQNGRYRWVFMDWPANFDMRNLVRDMEELSELLSDVKIEDVAESKGHESHWWYLDPLPPLGPPKHVPENLAKLPMHGDEVKPKE